MQGTRIKHFENRKRKKNVKMLYRVPRPEESVFYLTIDWLV